MNRLAGVCRVLGWLAAFTLALSAADRPGLVGAPVPGVRPLTAPGIENLFEVTERLISGGQPEGDAAFEALKRLGVKTILSVDGTAPDLERAARFGMRYVHVPHGYDGIPADSVARLVKAATTAEGRLYVHCHHGKHRGPAAVGIICQATAGWSTNQAVQWMRQAGTAPDYAGLFKANLGFEMPAAGVLAALPQRLPERVKVSGLVEAMVRVDRHWDAVKAVQSAGWSVPKGHPDLVPAAEALLLKEAYAELQRDPEARAKGVVFLGHVQDAEAAAGALHSLLKGQGLPLPAGLRERADVLARESARQCSVCHKAFRN